MLNIHIYTYIRIYIYIMFDSKIHAHASLAVDLFDTFVFASFE